MFFKPAIMKKLIKKAYKGSGLRIARTENVDGYYLSSGYWHAWMRKEFVSKEVMAAMVEVVGELPGPGICYKVTKEGNQLEMKFVIESLHEDFHRCTELYRETSMKLQHRDTECKLFQGTDSNSIVMINNVYAELISEKDIDKEHGEETPEGPYRNNTRLMWGNGDCYFAAVTKDPDCEAEQETLKNLEQVFVI